GIWLALMPRSTSLWGCLADLEQPGIACALHGFRSVSGIQLGKNIAQVAIRSVCTDLKRDCNLPIRSTIGNESEDLLLATSQCYCRTFSAPTSGPVALALQPSMDASRDAPEALVL